MTTVNDILLDREYVNKLLDSLPIGKKIQVIAYPYGKDYDNIVWKDTFTKVKEESGIFNGIPYVEFFFLYYSERRRDGLLIVEFVDELKISKRNGPFYGHSFDFKLLNRKVVSV